MIERSIFREAMSRLGAAVNVITTRGEAGDCGFTASAVCSVTDSPATVLVCMNRTSKQFEDFQKARILCVNVLGAEGEELSLIFSGQTEIPLVERFDHHEWMRLKTGAPVLVSAVTALDCVVGESVEVGSHRVLFCTVQAVHLGAQSSGLIYHQRRYVRLEADAIS